MTPLEWAVFSVVCGTLILLGYVDKSRQARKSELRVQRRQRAAYRT
jgi:predicted lysophospholipase L1 biosynthesis ABC-type transport system permease subunit